MNWIENINNALSFIEENLESDLTSEKIAAKACSSQFHFMRIFSVLTGRSLSEYIKERRLTKAGAELSSTKNKIIEIALKYGYETPEAFSKAFKRFHGITPSVARKNGHLLLVSPPLHIKVTLEGDKQMEYKIEKKGAFKVTGLSKEVTFSEAPVKLPEFGKELWNCGAIDEMHKHCGPLGVMGISYAHRLDEDLYRYMFGVEVTDSNKGIYGEILDIDESNWAIFNGEGEFPKCITEAWKKIFEEWFPATGYEHAPIPEIEFSEPSGEGRVKWEIWIPVLEK